MARRYSNSNNLERGVFLIVIFFVLSLFGLWKTDRNSFWLWVVLGIMAIAVIGIAVILWSEFKSKKNKNLLDSVRQAGAEEDIYNFINSFGYQKKAEKKPWSYEGYTFTWNQLDSFRKTLHEKGVQLSITDNYNDIGFLLRHYI